MPAPPSAVMLLVLSGGTDQAEEGEGG